jgi:hypothetical protein
MYREMMPPLWGIAAVGFCCSTRPIMVFGIIHILLSILPMMIAVDTFRLPFYVFPVILLWSGIGLQELSRKHDGFAWTAIGISWFLILYFPKSIIGGIVMLMVWLLIYFIGRTRHKWEGEA